MIRLAAIPSLLALVACADNYSVVIVRNIAAGATCEVTPSTQASRGEGFLDVTPVLPNGLINPGYILLPEVRNPTGEPAVTPTRPGNPNAHIFYVKGVDVQVLAGPDPDSETVVAALNAAGLGSRTVRLGTSIVPNGTISMPFTVLDFSMLQVMDAVLTEPVQIVVRIVVFGDIDGTEIETPPFDYPITVCAGCLLLDLGDCAAIPDGATIPTGGACAPLQDAALACCQTGAIDICPAVPTGDSGG